MELQSYSNKSKNPIDTDEESVEENNSLKIIPYSEENAAIWDEFLARAPMATFLQTRRYLSYHADRFQDVSLIIKDEKNRLVGLFPAAVDPSNSKRVVSHPGITYGGLLHTGNLRGAKMLEAFKALRHYYANHRFESLRYKVVPNIYHQVPVADDLYALFCMEAVRYRCDLSCAIDLTNRLEPSLRRKRGLKKALKNEVKVDFGFEFAGHLWSVIEDNLANKYGVKPVHSAKEIIHLYSLFPNNIEFVVGLYETQVLGGVVLFVSPQVVHAQYIASSPKGYQLGLLDAIFQKCIDKAKDLGKRYFSFGISTENEGKYLNTSLYQFKSEFGSSGVVHEFYEMNLGG
ncbi:MAG: GNAT family N-acetyltransferase [Nostoc sp.]|uniref:GNAT family N-acetyltransferase n=1 Tax=Nostoc sp. TaxID=1180 RepID=UPI002FF68F4B